MTGIKRGSLDRRDYWRMSNRPPNIHGAWGHACAALHRMLTWLGFGMLLVGQAGVLASQPASIDAVAADAHPGAWSDADIRASRVQTPLATGLAAGPVWQADPAKLFLVVEADGAHLSLLDGDRFEVVHRFASRAATLGKPSFTADGRFAYVGSRDGWIGQYDLRSLTPVAQVRAGRSLRHLALSADGRYLIAATSGPDQLVLLDADLQLVKHMVAASLDGKRTSPVSAICNAAQRKSFVVAFRDMPELWEISYNPQAEPIFDGLVHDYKMGEAIAKPGFLNARRTPLEAPLQSLALTPGHRNLLGAQRPKEGASAKSTTVQVINLDVRRKIAELTVAGVPELGAAVPFRHADRTVLASPRRDAAGIDVLDLDRWQSIQTIATPGPVRSLSSRERARHVWAVATKAPGPQGVLMRIDQHTLAPAASLLPSTQSPAQVALTHDGRYALVSAADGGGALLVLDTETLREFKRLPMQNPVGSYHASDEITRCQRAPD